MQPNPYKQPVRRQWKVTSTQRIKLWYVFIVLVAALFIGRLFYLQIVRHDFYRAAALADQLKEYSIPAQRGIIEVQDGNTTVPLVLNQTLYTLFADPAFSTVNAASEAQQVAAVVGGKASNYQSLMSVSGARYEVLAKRLSEAQNNKILALKLPGVGTQAQDYRVYPQGDLASQMLGFVDDSGQGRYGIEQTLNAQLAGTPGTLKAITDASGVPLAASPDNVKVDPKPGSNVVLTIDLAMQRGLESILRQGLQAVASKSGSAVIIDPTTCAIKAMANYPSYDPSKFYNVSDLSLFSNSAVSSTLEVGSIMKSLTVSAALDRRVITPDTAYHDPGYVTIDGSTIKNVLPITTPTITIKDVLQHSLNTGAVHMLKELGGGSLDKAGRDVWHDYMVNHFQLGKPTGIEQTGEASGSIPDPDHGYALDLQYAETAFGQGMSATILQMGAAFASAVNGGTYYKPHLVEAVVAPSGATNQTQPQIVKQNVISSQASAQVRELMQYVFTQNHTIYASNLHTGYNIGGKTGTAQIAKSGGGYLDGIYNGTFLGYVGGNMPQYVIAIRVDKPNLPAYDAAGSQAAAPIFGKIADMLINNFNVKPKSH